MGKKITDEQKQQILSMLEQGYRRYDIAERVGVHEKTVTDYSKKYFNKDRRAYKQHQTGCDREYRIKTENAEAKAIDAIYAIIMGGVGSE